jgi:SAM-dependent methyltransferase
VGVGTGWFLDNCRFPHDRPRITLLDLNPRCLERAATRIQRYDPKIVQANILEPLELETSQFGSIGLNYLLHCLPGTLKEKAVVFDHVKSYLAPGGIVFGSTLLAEGVKRFPIARALMQFYNSKGVFSNQEDSIRDLESELAARFRQVRLEVIGCAALFTAQ